jgi:hypothetical protein
MTSEMKQQQIDWRRAKVMELSSQGYSEREIAERLQPLAVCTVHRDLVYLRKQANENLHKHIHEVIPLEYEKAMLGMKHNLKQTLEIAETAADPKTKLQARSIINDCYKQIMDLITNSTVVTDALKYVTQKQEKIDTLKMIDERIEGIHEKIEEEETTTNGIF